MYISQILVFNFSILAIESEISHATFKKESMCVRIFSFLDYKKKYLKQVEIFNEMLKITCK